MTNETQPPEQTPAPKPATVAKPVTKPKSTAGVTKRTSTSTRRAASHSQTKTEYDRGYRSRGRVWPD